MDVNERCTPFLWPGFTEVELDCGGSVSDFFSGGFFSIWAGPPFLLGGVIGLGGASGAPSVASLADWGGEDCLTVVFLEGGGLLGAFLVGALGECELGEGGGCEGGRERVSMASGEVGGGTVPPVTG